MKSCRFCGEPISNRFFFCRTCYTTFDGEKLKEWHESSWYKELNAAQRIQDRIDEKEYFQLNDKVTDANMHDGRTNRKGNKEISWVIQSKILERYDLCERHEKTFKYRQTAREFGVSHSFVVQLIKRYRKTSNEV